MLQTMASRPYYLSMQPNGSGRIRFRVRPGIKRAVARLNRSQNSVAKDCGLTSGHLSQLLAGKRNPSPKIRERLLRALPEFTFDGLFEEIRS